MRNLKILFEDAAILLDCDRRALVVSDIHLGYELELAKKGVSLPQRATIISGKLIDLGKKHHTRWLYILGDVKHKVAWASQADWFQVTTFFNKLQTWFKDIVITLGNHDGGIRDLVPHNVQVVGSRGTTVQCKDNAVTLLHGNAWPRPESIKSSYIVTGHGHYMIELKDDSGLRLIEPVWVIGALDREKYTKERKYDLDAKSLERELTLVVLPAFNRIVGGIAVNRMGRRKPSPMMKYLIEDRTQLYLMDGTFISTLSKIMDMWKYEPLGEESSQHHKL
ncbi:MAG: metallophosphoesterase [Nitrososphaeria archaeon]